MQTKKEKLELARVKIDNLRKEQDQIYERLVEELKFDDNYLFDYCFNCSDPNNQYTKTCLEELYAREEFYNER